MLKVMKHKINILVVLMAAFFCMLPMLEASAASDTTVTQSSADEKEVYLFVDGIYGEVEQMNGYIGTETLTDIEWEWMKESATEIKTLVLMDTSLSIKSEVKDHFKTMLKVLAENKLPNESIAIATYGKTPKYLCDYELDTDALLQVIDSISYQKQNSFLYQGIYDIVVDFNELNDKCLKRIIIFSDGDDTNSEGVSKTEVLTLLDKTRYPIYAVGYAKDTNTDSLKDFFALSRTTGAKSVKFNQDTTEDEMDDVFSSIGDCLQIKIIPPVGAMDGGVKNIALEVVTTSEVYQVTADVRVGRVVATEPEVEEPEEEESFDTPEEDQEPVEEGESVVTPEVIPETEPEDAAEETPEDTDATEEETQQETTAITQVVTKTPKAEEAKAEAPEGKKGGFPLKEIAIVILLLAAAGLGVYFVLKKVNEQKAAGGAGAMQVMPPMQPMAPQAAQGMAAPMQANTAPPVQGMPAPMQANMTPPAQGMNAYAPAANYHGLEVILEDKVSKQNISIRMSDYAEGRFVSIGRNREKCDVTIDYDGGISQLHCVMYTAGNSVFVEDCQSTNHTYLNGNQLTEPESIAEGDVLTLGKVKFIVHIVLR